MESFITFLTTYLLTLETNYRWPKRPPKTPLQVPMSAYQVADNGMTMCINLKRHLTDEWRKADMTQKYQLAHWIVKDWGGVRANAPDRIQQYVDRIIASDIPTGVAGVASFSKILSVVDCTRYAIYDARVAAGLNAVQLLFPTAEPRYFPHVPSRNNTIRRFSDWFAARPPDNAWEPVPRDSAYSVYCQLLHDLKPHVSGHEIYHIEMALFSAAPSLCQRAMEIPALEPALRKPGL
ncbi:hypothetical protein CLV58_1446 [Spirosoma oryzae]|uniref:Uncharacterized protein n=1 Tax=Spirosoma oryzae TaxID=1469603 RepID=A0A2T0RNE5_9BACT|nr:hypothetical protein [Spirosoma oryzae]PRY22726.1 hypothetical protein CLV58_1446 [Spirosoma oryzae]